MGLPAPWHKLSKDHGGGNLAFVREAILGHCPWNFHSNQCAFLMVGAEQRWRHGRVGCVLISNGDMDVCFVAAERQQTHGCA